MNPDIHPEKKGATDVVILGISRETAPSLEGATVGVPQEEEITQDPALILVTDTAETREEMTGGTIEDTLDLLLPGAAEIGTTEREDPTAALPATLNDESL